MPTGGGTAPAGPLSGRRRATAQGAGAPTAPGPPGFAGGPSPGLPGRPGGNLPVDSARRAGRDAADDRIVETVEDAYGAEPDLTVVTSDRGLVGRLPPGVGVEGAGRFRTRVGLGRPTPRRGR